jgi:hypothetical protein
MTIELFESVSRITAINRAAVAAGDMRTNAGLLPEQRQQLRGLYLFARQKPGAGKPADPVRAGDLDSEFACRIRGDQPAATAAGDRYFTQFMSGISRHIGGTPTRVRIARIAEQIQRMQDAVQRVDWGRRG